MPITADFHMHSAHSGDGCTPMEEMIRQAVRAGMTHICFTEHLDIDYPAAPDLPEHYFLLDTESCFHELTRLRSVWADRIRIGFGVELGLQPHLRDTHTRYVASHAFDFVIGSSHICNGRDPYYPAFYEGRTEEEAYREYFASILENLDVFHDFGVYGHLDYVVRYGPHKDRDYTYEKYRDILDRIIDRLLALGKGLELNTGGLANGLREPNPCTAILKQYRKRGGEIITIGSDAHVPERIGHAFATAQEILKDCGFSHYTTFEKRQPVCHRLP